jgi:putative ABC transport system permease protein
MGRMNPISLPLAAEIRQAIRRFLWRPWRTVLVVLILALATATHAVVTSVAEDVALGRLPYSESGSLGVLQSPQLHQGMSDYVPPEAIEFWGRQTDVFAAVHAFDRDASMFFSTPRGSEFVPVTLVTPGLLDQLGARPRWGRTFLDSDVTSRSDVIVVSEELARREFESPERAIGRKVGPSDASSEIVGVLPGGFRFPTTQGEIWKPMDVASRGTANVRNVIRLAAGVSLAEANVQIQSRAASFYGPLVETSPAGRQTAVRALATGTRLVELRTALGTADQRTRMLLLLLVGGATLLLLIAGANVASLQLGDALAKEPVWATQLALGATRLSLVRAVVIEGCLLALGGTLLASVLVHWSLAGLVALWPASVARPLALGSTADPHVLAVLAATFLLTWSVAALPVAIHAWRHDVRLCVSGSRLVGGTKRIARARHVLGIVQTGMTVFLAFCAIALMTTYRTALGLDKGFDGGRLVAVEINPGPMSRTNQLALDKLIAERLGNQPGIEAVSRVSDIPPSTAGGYMAPLIVGAQRFGEIKLATYSVDPAFFSTMGLPLRSGAGFTPSSGRRAVIIDENFAKRFWPNQNPVGQRFRVGLEFEIVGVASAVRYDAQRSSGGDDIFVAYQPLGNDATSLKYILRLQRASQTGDISAVLRTIAPAAILKLAPINDRYALLQERTRFAALLGSILAALATLVAILGIYALATFSVQTRIRDIGVRLALGAQKKNIYELVLRTVISTVTAGVAFGWVVALLASRLGRSFLDDFTMPSMLTAVGIAATMVIASGAAALGPAMRAARLDPVSTLRQP